MLILIDTVDTYDTSDIFFRVHKKDVVAVLFFFVLLDHPGKVNGKSGLHSASRVS